MSSPVKIKTHKNKKKIRVNISVDRDLLEKAKNKLEMFGGKVSTLFNSYLHDFVESMEKKLEDHPKTGKEKMKELEEKLKKLEDEIKRMDKLDKFYKDFKGL